MKLKKFIKKLKRLVEIEREAEMIAMLEEMKKMSGEKREKLGRAILGLSGKVVGEEFGFKLLRLGRRKKIETEIKVGDLVLLSKGNPFKNSLSGTVVEKGSHFLTVSLERLPSFSLKNIRVDLWVNDITFSRQLENLSRLSREAKEILEYALSQKRPKPPQKEKIDFFDKNLNESQKLAVSFSLGTKNFFLIYGPFGTGKTKTLVEIILQAKKRGKKILVCAESNVAVDNLVEKLKDKAKIVRLGHPSRTSKELKETTLFAKIEKEDQFEMIKKLREEKERLLKKRNLYPKPTSFLKRGLSDKEILFFAKKRKRVRGLSLRKLSSMARWIEINEKIKKKIEKEKEIEKFLAKKIVKEAEIVLATNSSSALEIIKDIKFDFCVIDEATQATIPSVLLPLSKAKVFIFAGDHKQLPPTVLDERAKELERTLFEILVEKYPQHSKLLEVQYRMNEKLMKFSNEKFYQGKLKTYPKVANITLEDFGIKLSKKEKSPWKEILDPQNVLVFIDTSKMENKWERQRKDSPSKENPCEAKIIKKLIKKLKKMGLKKEWIGVITPYDDQVDLLKREIEDIEISTVDGFQGREKEVILISFVRSNPKKEIGFLKDLRRLNTALTRPKRKLIAVGDSETLSSYQIYKEFLEFVKKEGKFIVL